MRVLTFPRILVASALRGLRASPVTAVVGALTLAITLVLVGTFGLALLNMRDLLERVGSDITLSAYLSPDLSESERANLRERIASVEGVESIEYVSPEQARERFEAGVGARLPLLEGLEENPLPAAFEISLLPEARTPAGLRIAVESIEGLRGVDDLGYGLEWVESYARLVSLFGVAATGLSVIMALAALLIVSNTIHLAFYARRDELTILSIVGASRTFMALPFVMEGFVQGAVGGLLALGCLYTGFLLVIPAVTSGLALLFGHAEPQFFSTLEGGALVAGGALLGVLGSVLALAGSRLR